MKIAVCDDRPEHLKKIRELLGKYQQTRPGLESQAEYFLSGAELLDQAEERGGYDLYLLDILMPGENGISVGKRLRQMGKQGELIFLTSSNDYAADSYEVRAFFYLLKPVEEEKLFRVLDQAVEKLTQQQKKTMLLETREGTRCIPLGRILYAERAGRVMRCHWHRWGSGFPDPADALPGSRGAAAGRPAVLSVRRQFCAELPACHRYQGAGGAAGQW